MDALKYIFDFVCCHGMGKIEFLNQDYKNTDMHRSTNFQNPRDETLVGRCNHEKFEVIFTDLIDKFLGVQIQDGDIQRTNFQAKVENRLFDVAVKGLCKVMDMGKCTHSMFCAMYTMVLIIHF